MPFESLDSHTFAKPKVAHGYEARKTKKIPISLKLNFFLILSMDIVRLFR